MLFRAGTSVDVEVHNLDSVAAVGRRPGGQALSIGVSGLHEAGVIRLQQVGKLVIIGRPGVNLVGREVAHEILDVRRVHRTLRRWWVWYLLRSRSCYHTAGQTR